MNNSNGSGQEKAADYFLEQTKQLATFSAAFLAALLAYATASGGFSSAWLWIAMACLAGSMLGTNFTMGKITMLAASGRFRQIFDEARAGSIVSYLLFLAGTLFSIAFLYLSSSPNLVDPNCI